MKSAHTYSDKRPTASSLHFSTGSDSTLKRGFTRNSISPCSTSGGWAGLLPTVSRFKWSRALLRVVRLSSERQFTSRWSFCGWKGLKWTFSLLEGVNACLKASNGPDHSCYYLHQTLDVGIGWDNHRYIYDMLPESCSHGLNQCMHLQAAKLSVL